jgi:hypothetical protein
MKDWLDQKLSPCNVNECIVMTNREFLAFAFGLETFYYKVVFKTDVNIDKEEFCEEQKFEIWLRI